MIWQQLALSAWKSVRPEVVGADAGAKYYFFAWELPIFVLMGCIGGLSGALWIRINIAMTRLRAQHVPARAVRRRLAEVRITIPCSRGLLHSQRLAQY